MLDDIPPSLQETARLQHGVCSARQLLDAGLTRDALAFRVERGRWQRLYRGVYATYSGQPGRQAQLWAAILVACPGAMLSYGTAAEVSGLTDRQSGLIHLTVPSDRRIARPPGIAVHYSSRASQKVHPARLPAQTRVEETVLDLASVARGLDEAVAWVTRALGQRLTSQEKLRAAMQARAKMRWRTELAALLHPESAGIHSVLEWRYHRDVELPHGLPAGSRQARFRSSSHNAYRDRLYEAYLTVVELDGRAAHPDGERWLDIRRDNAAAAGGITTLRYGWLDVTQRPCLVAAEVATALAARGFSGAHPCSARCPVGRAGQCRPSA